MAGKRPARRLAIPLTIDSTVASPLAEANGSANPATASPKRSALKEDDFSRMDPDEMFSRFGIAEMKNVQLKLMADADAKKEELRLMVGERYRDLLQASTSIIAISRASQHVMATLTEMKAACADEDPSPIQMPMRKVPQDDGHLRILQSLSAHIKLLLDAPEHLWRLLEQRLYLRAAWLFLLSRVVYRALVKDDDDSDEDIWQALGIDVAGQIPLVQRQWDSIAHFRSNIAYRATQSLREHKTSDNDACSTLISLHLLESLPLTDTLSTLLAERSRTLKALLNRAVSPSGPRSASPVSKSRQKNLEAVSLLMGASQEAKIARAKKKRKDVVREVGDILTALIEVLSSTIGVARVIFHSGSSGGKSMIEHRVEEIQTSDENEDPSDSLARISTRSILASLPSSTHLLTLPPSIQSYHPFIDLAAPSTHIDPLALNRNVKDWFESGLEGVQGRIPAWFDELESVSEIWAIRARLLHDVGSGKLSDEEQARLTTLMDDACKTRARDIWTSKFRLLATTLSSSLGDALDSIGNEKEKSSQDTLPTTFLFSPPAVPSLSQVGANPTFALSSFAQFKTALKHRVARRTPLLHALLQEIEEVAGELKRDFAVVEQSASGTLIQQLMDLYHPVVEASCQDIWSILQTAMSNEEAKYKSTSLNPDSESQADMSVATAIFIGRISHECATSAFISDIRVLPESAVDIRHSLKKLHDRSIEIWRENVLARASKKWEVAFLSAGDPGSQGVSVPSGPSSGLIESLLWLIAASEQLGLSRAQLREKQAVAAIMSDFAAFLLKGAQERASSWSRNNAQLLWDLVFVSKLVEIPLLPRKSGKGRPSFVEELNQFQEKITMTAPNDIKPRLCADLDLSVSQHLCRSQILLAPLYTWESWNTGSGEKPGAKSAATALLPLGPPVVGSDFQAAMELAKPGPRFALLAVAGSTVHIGR